MDELTLSPKAERNRGFGGRAIVALHMEDLTMWTVERTAKMPREHKFTVGDKLVETCLEITTLLAEASYVRDKLALLAAASRGLTRARLLVRIGQRLHLLSAAQREFFSSQSLAIGKMIGGWTKPANGPTCRRPPLCPPPQRHPDRVCGDSA